MKTVRCERFRDDVVEAYTSGFPPDGELSPYFDHLHKCMHCQEWLAINRFMCLDFEPIIIEIPDYLEFL